MRRILGLLFFLLATTASYGAGEQGPYAQYTRYPNTLVNPGFEKGKARWVNTGSGTFTTTTTAADVGIGSASGVWDAAVSGDKLSQVITIPPGLYGQSCQASLIYRKAAGGSSPQFEIIDDAGPTTLASATLGTSTTYVKTVLGFTCPSSGTMTFQLRVTGNAAATYIDDLYLGIGNFVDTNTQQTLSNKFITGPTNDVSGAVATNFQSGGGAVYTFAGGTNYIATNPGTSAGDLFYCSNTGTPCAMVRLGIGSTNQVLHGGASAPSYSAVDLAADVSGTLPIANGGTNGATATAGFDNLSPMTAAGDLIYGGSAGTRTRLAPGTSTQLLHSGTTPSWSGVVSADITDGTIVNADINASAAIEGSKLVAASGSVAGAVTTTTQTLAGAKTLTGVLTVDTSTTGIVTEIRGTYGSIRLALDVGLYRTTAATSVSCDTGCASDDANAGFESTSGHCIGANRGDSNHAPVTCDDASAGYTKSCLCMGR